MRKALYIFYIVAIGLLIASCSTRKNTARTRAWHSFSAKYNTYYNGKLAYIDGALEKEKGKWTFCDASIERFRRHHIKIFAQLGTAPAWATHYHDLGCKQMGYFEKFLRPVDTNAWLNYVTTFVKRYDGVIDEYFVWNEPWGRWWMSAADIKYYDATRAAEDFGVFQSLTYRAVKAVNPKIRVSGFNSYASKGGGDWSRGVAAGGGWETCDIVDYHVDTPHPRAAHGRQLHREVLRPGPGGTSQPRQ